MNNKFQIAVKKIMENNTVSGVLGTPMNAIYNPNDIVNKDSYAPNDTRRPKLLGKKVIRRNLPKDTIFSGKKQKNKK